MSCSKSVSQLGLGSTVLVFVQEGFSPFSVVNPEKKKHEEKPTMLNVRVPLKRRRTVCLYACIRDVSHLAVSDSV